MRNKLRGQNQVPIFTHKFRYIIPKCKKLFALFSFLESFPPRDAVNN